MLYYLFFRNYIKNQIRVRKDIKYYKYYISQKRNYKENSKTHRNFIII